MRTKGIWTPVLKSTEDEDSSGWGAPTRKVRSGAELREKQNRTPTRAPGHPRLPPLGRAGPGSPHRRLVECEVGASSRPESPTNAQNVRSLGPPPGMTGRHPLPHRHPPQKKERKKSFDPIKGQVTLPSGAAPAGAGMARGGGRGEGDTTHERETDRQADRPTTVPPTRRELGKENKASPAPPARRRPPARAGRLSRGPTSRPRPHDKD